MRTHGFGVLMVVLSLALAFGLAVFLVASVMRGSRPVFGRLALAVCAWGAVYTSLLLGVSLSSEERVLGRGEDLKFCGFYLDCHRQVAVAAVEVLDSLGSTKPAGVFHVVTLRIASDARAVSLRLSDPRVVVVTGDGRPEFTRSAAGEAALAALRGPQPPLTDAVGPGGGFTTTVVFDLPRDAAEARLRVTDGFWADRLVELFLIGDEDSLLHPRTSFRLAA